MKILHLSAECYPVAKVGGLADVVGSLPKYQNTSNTKAQVVIPFYENTYTRDHKFIEVFTSEIKLGLTPYAFSILKLQNVALGFELFLVDIPDLLYTNYVYSNDDAERFLAFQIAVLDWILEWDEKPAIVHCHDHHTGLTPFLMTKCFKYAGLKLIPTVITIHNAQYQGWFSYDKLNLVPDFDLKDVGLLDWNNSINPLATAIKCAWRVTTVSPSYMNELMESANGLESLLRQEQDKCIGILNGIDTEVWNPEKDEFLVSKYKASNVVSGKKSNKKWLCKKFNLDFNRPLFAFIGRLVGEKGTDIFSEAFRQALQNNHISILLLGSGNELIAHEMLKIRDEFSDSFNVYIGYNEELAHIIYAGADFLLMPSRVEPCGLNQMYALRYGTIPIVRSIGGLKDTVTDIAEDDGFGICFKNVDANELTYAIQRAVEFYRKEPDTFKKTLKNSMDIDHSWNASAKEYINLYKSLIF